MAELVVKVEDVSLLEDIEKSISLLRGVVGVSLKRKRKTELQRAIEAEERGELYEAKDVEDLMRQLNS